jgi:hypothetical protein
MNTANVENPSKIKYTHRMNVEAVLCADGTWGLCGVTTRSLPCGCAVTGGGVLPSPLTVTLCAGHAAAKAALENVLAHQYCMVDSAGREATNESFKDAMRQARTALDMMDAA